MLHQISCTENISLVNSDRDVFGDGAGTLASLSFYADEFAGGCEEIPTAPASLVEVTAEGKKSAKKRARKKVSELFTRRIKRSALDVHSDEGAVNVFLFFFSAAMHSERSLLRDHRLPKSSIL
jgi:hypothetical protein